MSSLTSSPLDPASWLRDGQTLEAKGDNPNLVRAVECYDRAITLLRPQAATHPSANRELAIAWMNRGNALQKCPGPGNLSRAIAAYDQAIAHIGSLPLDSIPGLTNSLGAAWLNRSHALQGLGSSHHSEAMHSCGKAIAILEGQAIEADLAARANLAGAHINLAHLLIGGNGEAHYQRAHDSAAIALNLSAKHELQRSAFADIGLKARRVLCEIIGQWLIKTKKPSDRRQLIATASDAVDTGLILARRWDSTDTSCFRPLAERLFRFGTAFYRRHQPHFLADFVLENLDPEHSSDAYLDFAALNQIALDALNATHEELRTQHLFISGAPATERRLRALRAIAAAQARLAPSASVLHSS